MAKIKAMKKDINRLKVVLVENKRTNKWLAEQLGKEPISGWKWYTNKKKPNLETLGQIAELLKVDIRCLLWSTADKNNSLTND